MNDAPKNGLDDVLGHVVTCDHEAEEPDLRGGRRVEFVVTGVRGVRVDAQAVGDPTTTYASSAATLAQNLRTEAGSLLGRRFSCRVVPATAGTFYADFQLTPEPPAPASG